MISEHYDVIDKYVIDINNDVAPVINNYIATFIRLPPKSPEFRKLAKTTMERLADIEEKYMSLGELFPTECNESKWIFKNRDDNDIVSEPEYRRFILRNNIGALALLFSSYFMDYLNNLTISVTYNVGKLVRDYVARDNRFCGIYLTIVDSLPVDAPYNHARSNPVEYQPSGGLIRSYGNFIHFTSVWDNQYIPSTAERIFGSVTSYNMLINNALVFIWKDKYTGARNEFYNMSPTFLSGYVYDEKKEYKQMVKISPGSKYIKYKQRLYLPHV